METKLKRAVKPPLGVTPKTLLEERRFNELKEAIEKWLACKGLDDKYVVGVRELVFCDEELRYVNKPWSRSRNNNYLTIMKVDEVQYGP